MSKKRKQEQQTPQKKRSTPVAAAVVTLLLILALVVVLTYQPPKTAVTIPPSSTTDQPTSYEFVKQGEVGFMTAKRVFIASIDAQLAQSEAERQVGLMYRDKLAENQGMLFIFEEDEPRSFWMKNTILSLDMLFVNAQGEIVAIHKYTKPYSEESYSSIKPAKFVVEVNAGYTDKYKISVGDRITWKRF